MTKMTSPFAKVIKACMAFGIAMPVAAQWATSGANIYNTNTGNVGIGSLCSR
jgi:hypothetical protein